MTQVEAANAGSARQPSQSRFTVLDPAPGLPAVAGRAEEFASLLTRTLQSPSWLTYLQERRGDQVGPTARRQQELADKAGRPSRAEALREAADRGGDTTESRSDRLRETAENETRSDRLKADTADQAESPDPRTASRDSADSAPPDARTDRTARPDASTPPSDAEAEEAAPAVEETTAWSVGLTALPFAGGPGSFSAFAETVQVPHAAVAGPIGGTPGSPSQLGPGGSPGQAASGQEDAGMGGAARVSALPGTDASVGGDSRGGSSADATASGGTVRGGEGGPKAGGTGADFQQMLQQVGRLRGSAGGVQNLGEGPARTAEGTVKLTEPQAATDLARVVRSAVGARHSSMVLRLDPPELGQVRVDVRMHDQTLTLRFHTQTQAGYDALHTRLDDLQQALERQGIQLDRVDVELRQPSSPGDARQEGTQDRQLPTHSGSGFGDLPGQQGAAQGSAARDEAGGGAYEHDRLPSEQAAEQDSWNDDGARLTESGVDLIV